MTAKWHNTASKVNRTIAANITGHVRQQNKNARDKIMHWRQ